MTAEFAKSLLELSVRYRDLSVHPLSPWNHLRSFFLSHGLALWVASSELRESIAPDDRPRAPDAFNYRSQDDVDRVNRFYHRTPFLCPARTLDGRDVMIRVISIGDDGASHHDALKRLATGNVASVIGNHCAPVLEWLYWNDVSFAVFPYLSAIDPTRYWIYEDVEDLLKHLLQMFEALEFCHSRLVAHRDVFEGNFLCNYSDGLGFHTLNAPPARGERVKPFRSLFPFKLFLIDFEMAVCFDPDSDPETRLVTGIPGRLGPDDSRTYARPMAPEIPDDKPYDPFLMDVWQLGVYVSDVCEDYNVPPPVSHLLTQMIATTPSERPTAAKARTILSSIISELSLGELKAAAWED